MAWISGASVRPDPAKAAAPQAVVAAPAAKASTSPAPKASRAFPLGALVQSQPLATAAGGLLVALLLADRLVLWKRPRWLLHLSDDGLEIPIGSGNVLRLGSRLFQALKYRDRVLDAWLK